MEEIINSTVKILYDLLKLYRKKELTYETFNKHATLKIRFLRDNLDKISSHEERAYAEQILKKCENITLKQQNPHFYNIQL